jgi:hypothetical protein
MEILFEPDCSLWEGVMWLPQVTVYGEAKWATE